MPFNLPVSLTLLRILLIPAFVIAFLLPVTWSNTLSTALFIIAAITDWLDGYLARRLGQLSSFGAFLDPVADKLMVGAALVLLVQSLATPWVTVAAIIIIGREIVISALREWMAQSGKSASVAVSMLGKYKTTTQMLALILLLYNEPIAGFPTVEVGLVLLAIAAILTLWSMIDYLMAAWPTIKR